MKMNEIAKAIIGAATALGTGVGTAVADGSITATEYVFIGVGVVIAFFAVWATENRSPLPPVPPPTQKVDVNVH